MHGGAVRAGIFGISDGLVTNLSLILGVAGAHSDDRGRYALSAHGVAVLPNPMLAGFGDDADEALSGACCKHGSEVLSEFVADLRQAVAAAARAGV